MPDAARYGAVTVEGDRVMRFSEKEGGNGLVNAGVYVIERELLARIPVNEVVSLGTRRLPRGAPRRLMLAAYEHSGASRTSARRRRFRDIRPRAGSDPCRVRLSFSTATVR